MLEQGSKTAHKKSCIRETKHILTDADSSTDTKKILLITSRSLLYNLLIPVLSFDFKTYLKKKYVLIYDKKFHLLVNKLRSLIVSQNHYLIKILDVHRLQNSLALPVWDWQCFEDILAKGWLNQLMNEWMNDKAVYRTALIGSQCIGEILRVCVCVCLYLSCASNMTHFIPSLPDPPKWIQETQVSPS